jgi:hypothetical protein
MKNINIRKIRTLLLMSMLSICFLSSCSKDDDVSGYKEEDKRIQLAISLNAHEEGTEIPDNRSTGDPSHPDESKIYSLEVLIFKSDDGTLDGYKSIPRTIVNVAGQNYDKEYKEIDEIKGISLTAGKRDIYVVANAADNSFQNITNLTAFKASFESLSKQGLYAHPGVTTPNPNDDPIGGQKPSDLKTNLTMFSSMKNIQFSNQDTQHYLGYTSNNGRPTGVSTGKVINGTNPFIVERLVARVALLKAKFDLPTSMVFETGFPTSVYTYQLDSVFLVNTKLSSRYQNETTNSLAGSFGHGSKLGFNYLRLQMPTSITAANQYTNYLAEPVSTRDYDITVNDSPIWFYLFENSESSQYPTYMVIGARFNFRSTKDGKLKTVKCYYPVIINRNGTTSGAGHNFIRRNYQYGLNVTIKGLGNIYSSAGIEDLRSVNYPLQDSSIEVKEVVAQNLFPWNGNVYK